MVRSRRLLQETDLCLKPVSPCRSLRAKVRKVICLLEEKYGIPSSTVRSDPVDVLIETILSQNTNDLNRDRAYGRLKTRFPSWEDLLKGKAKQVVQAIRPGGLANQKAKRIHEVLRWIKKEYGSLSLASLRRMDSEKIKRTMGALKGVGPKTVHCFLLFGMGRDVFPVDTHILRVGKRMGFIPDGMSAEEAHPWMVPLVPKGKSLSLHLNLIRFGRSLCRARKPQCRPCFLAGECLWCAP